MNMNKRLSKSTKSKHSVTGTLNALKNAAPYHVVSSSPIVRTNRHPVLKGILSLGTVGSRISDYRAYLKGNNAEDMANDWECVGMSLKISISKINKELF